MCKYIFVSGGVVSGLGKGITMAGIGRLLKERGLRVSAMKLDPYINVDPGTMSPLQHGEVFVCDDGSETDLDLGHYERFMDEAMTTYSNLTSGRCYDTVLRKEREGAYLGQTVQVIPHITNEIKRHITLGAKENACDVLLCEVGGTVGDIESQPFLEAIRQLIQENKKEDCLFLHVTLVPYLTSSQEFKSKPTQHSVKQLQSYGIMPDMIIARSETPLPQDIIKKISLFCNIEEACVINNYDLSSLYQVVPMLKQAGIVDIIANKLRITYPHKASNEWDILLAKEAALTHHVHVGIIGKYVSLHDAYLSIKEALYHAAIHNEAHVHIHWIDSEDIEHGSTHELLKDCDAILIPGGFGNRGIEGKIQAAQYAREHGIPFLGICLGMQIASIEFARHVLQLHDANSIEFQPTCEHAIIHYMKDQSDEQQKGGTMRLGAYPCYIKKDSLLYTCYQRDVVQERHRHRYEFNSAYRSLFEEHGMHITGLGQQDLVEAIELVNHPFYIAVQYHPEFLSRPTKPHPLFQRLLYSAIHK